MKKFKSNEELFRFIHEIVDLANNNDDDETKELILEVFRNNFITSEIWSDLRKALIILQNEKGKGKEYLDPIQDGINTAIKTIEHAFKNANRLRF
jgi:hypothetical protein